MRSPPWVPLPTKAGSISFGCWCKPAPTACLRGQVGARLGLPAATLSFHLNQLRHASLIKFRREGRSLIYAAEYSAMNSLVGYLTENCCQDSGTCSVAASTTRLTRVSKGVRSHETHARSRRR